MSYINHGWSRAIDSLSVCYCLHCIVMFWQLSLRDAVYNKRQSKPKVLSGMDNPETLATLGTQDTGRKQTNHNTTQHSKVKTMRKNGSIASSVFYGFYLLF